VAQWCDDPPSEVDLHARHLALLASEAELSGRLMSDPEHYDARLAGWWVWGACCWIGSGWCSGKGPWVAGKTGLVKAGTRGQGIAEALSALAVRLERVRIACGDWSRVCGPSVTWCHGCTAVFLDPPYGADNDIDYAGGGGCAEDVRVWALEHGNRSDMRIALCGYAGGGHEALEGQGWTVEAWKARGGYGSQGDGSGRANATRERIWFSPHCKAKAQGVLF